MFFLIPLAKSRFATLVRGSGQGASPQLLCVLYKGGRASAYWKLPQHTYLFRGYLRVNDRTSVLSSVTPLFASLACDTVWTAFI